MRFTGLALTLVFGPVAALVACGARVDSGGSLDMDAAIEDVARAEAAPTTTATPTTTPSTTPPPPATTTAPPPPGDTLVHCAPIAPPPFPTVTCSANSECNLAPGASAPTCTPHEGPSNCGIAHCTGRCTCVISGNCGCAR